MGGILKSQSGVLQENCFIVSGHRTGTSCQSTQILLRSLNVCIMPNAFFTDQANT